MPGRAQTAAGPRVELVPAPTTVVLPGLVDSNSPFVWERVDGLLRLFVLTSVDGQPHVASGPTIAHLGRVVEASLEPWPGGGVWMEGIIADTNGTWYGYYHNEVPAPACPTTARQSPRIGAARSRDHGRTWESLGIILDVPPTTATCTTRNKYFDGGVGDISVQLDPNSQDLYFFISSYPRFQTRQGVSVARMAWADRAAAPSSSPCTWSPSSFLLPRFPRWPAISRWRPKPPGCRHRRAWRRRAPRGAVRGRDSCRSQNALRVFHSRGSGDR